MPISAIGDPRKGRWVQERTQNDKIDEIITAVNLTGTAAADTALDARLDILEIDHAATEKNTGTKFLTKTVYSKVLTVALADSGAAVVAHGVAGIGLSATLDFCEVRGMVSDGTTWKPWQEVATLVVDATNCTFTTTTDQDAFSGKLILFYTKAA